MIVDVVERWARHLRSTGRGERTIAAYRSDVNLLRRFVADADLLTVTPQTISDFLASSASDGLNASTVTRRFRSIGRFYAWLEHKHEVSVSPVSKNALPIAHSDGADLLSVRERAALLGACSDTNASGRQGRVGVFESRRDTALVMLLITTGMTSSEIIGLQVDDLDLDARSVHVRGRPKRERDTSLLQLPADAIEKYLVEREHHKLAISVSMLWLGERGALTRSGLRQMLERRCVSAGVRPVRAGHFRRTFASEALGNGMTERTLAEIGGWGSAQSVRRYHPSTD